MACLKEKTLDFINKNKGIGNSNGNGIVLFRISL